MATEDEVVPSLPPKLGPYTIGRRIAVGGMSEVYLARADQAVGAARTVVLKRMLPKVAADPAMRAMFADEASMGRRIQHPNVVEVIDFLTLESGESALALEYVQGVDLWRLGRWLTRSGQRLPMELAVFVAREMLQGLHAVHDARDENGGRLGIVHRDVSPSNVLLSIHGDVKLGDLGIAKAAARERYPEAGVDDRTKGKLGYLAPEQVRGLQPDRRSDVFSAAVVIAELLMGRPLFSGGSELAVLLAIRDSQIHPFLEFARELPEGLSQIVCDALAAQPARRPPSALLFAQQLGAFQQRPKLELQDELSNYVRSAQEEGRTASASLPPSPTRTVTDPAAEFNRWLREEPARRSLAPPMADSATAYVIQTVSGEQLGPWPFAKVVEAVSTGHLGPMDRVEVDGSAPRLLSELPDLARHIPGSTSTTKRGVEEPMVHSGALVPMAAGGFVGALANAAVEGFTGLLLCQREGVRKEVYLNLGTPAFVTSNQPSELLGEHLVERGVITRAELDMALAVMPRFEGRLGDTLAGLGLVEPVTLFRHIGEQVRDKLLELFLWTDGSCTHYVGVSPPESSFPLELSSWDVIDEGVQWRVSRGLEDTTLARAGNTPAQTVPSHPLASRREPLPSHLGVVLQALTTATEPAHLWSQEPSADGRVALQRGLLVLLHMGAVQWCPQA